MMTEAFAPETIVVLVGIGAAILIILILTLTRKLGKFLLLAGSLATVFVFARAMWSQAQATRATAQAAEEAVEAVALESVLVVVLAILLVIVAVLAIVAAVYFWLRARQADRRAESVRRGNWEPGPNALWGRRDGRLSAPVQIADGGIGSLAPLLMQQMATMQAMMMTLLQQGRPVGSPQWRDWTPDTPPALPLGSYYTPSEDDIPPDWDWWPPCTRGEDGGGW
jgi:hypothetical protein